MCCCQFGFLDMGFGTENVLGGGDIDDDGDLEAELSALTQGSQKQQNKKGKVIKINCCHLVYTELK